MSQRTEVLIKRWTEKQAAVLAVFCLTMGIAGGWAIRGSQSSGIAESGKAAIVAVSSAAGDSHTPQTPLPARLKDMADAKAAPLVNTLKSDPKNPELLASIGNIYYDAQQFPVAIDYYERALGLKPSDAAIRTDMGTALWYTGKADSAIAEFNKALGYAPNNPNTLFNLGLVKSKGKMDYAGAVADWERLLSTHPDYEGKDKVKQMIAEAKAQEPSSSK